MEKEFVPYELAVKLKALGFAEPCLANYTVIPEDEIDWFTIPEQGITDKTSFGSSKNYNSKSFEEEGTISAPTFSQAFRWFREKYSFSSEINVYSISGGYSYSFKILCKRYTPYIEANNNWPTYEEAELACLDKLIEIVENKPE